MIRWTGSLLVFSGPLLLTPYFILSIFLSLFSFFNIRVEPLHDDKWHGPVGAFLRRLQDDGVEPEHMLCHAFTSASYR